MYVEMEKAISKIEYEIAQEDALKDTLKDVDNAIAVESMIMDGLSNS